MEIDQAIEKSCFRRLGGMDQVFEPAGCTKREGKKHPCPDCSFCQSCAETRCLTCRSERNRKGFALCKKLSIGEQILLYEKVNAEASEKRKIAAKSDSNLEPSNIQVEI
jgi:hypothetical protein